MGSANWTELSSGLNAAAVARAVSTGITPPNGGGSFVFVFNSLVTSEGVVSFFANQTNFAPTPANKGGRITGAVQRGVSAGNTNFAPFLFMLGQGTAVTDEAYILGLEDDSPHRISLRKGAISSGLPSATPGTSGILRRSTATYSNGVWHHLRLDAVVNVSGDVILKAFENDLNTNAVTSPVWTAIAGIEDSTLVASHGAGTAFIDDAAGINSGSAPYSSGRMGYGFYTKDISRRGYFDHIECFRDSS